MWPFGKKSPEPGSGEQNPEEFTMPANAEAGGDINLVPGNAETPTEVSQPTDGGMMSESATFVPEQQAVDASVAPANAEAGVGVVNAESPQEVITDKNAPGYDAFAALAQSRADSAAEREAISAERQAGLDVLREQEPSFSAHDSGDIQALGAEVQAGKIAAVENTPDEASMQEALAATEQLGVTGDVIINESPVIETTGRVVESSGAEADQSAESPIEPMSTEGDTEQAA